jgi:hypothetical protein
MMLARPDDGKARRLLKRFEMCVGLAKMTQVSMLTAGVIWFVVPAGYYAMLWPAMFLFASLLLVMHFILVGVYLFLIPLRRTGAVIVIQRSTQYALFKRLRGMKRVDLPSMQERCMILFNLQQAKNGAAKRASEEFLQAEFERTPVA